MSGHFNLIEDLRQQGYRLTPQREMVLEAVHESQGHVSAEEIYAKVQARNPYVHISTVYRTLELLKQLHLVCEIDLGGGSFATNWPTSGDITTSSARSAERCRNWMTRCCPPSKTLCGSSMASRPTWIILPSLDAAAVARRELEPTINLLLLDHQIQQLGSGSDDPLRAFVIY